MVCNVICPDVWYKWPPAGQHTKLVEVLSRLQWGERGRAIVNQWSKKNKEVYHSARITLPWVVFGGIFGGGSQEKRQVLTAIIITSVSSWLNVNMFSFLFYFFIFLFLYSFIILTLLFKFAGFTCVCPWAFTMYYLHTENHLHRLTTQWTLSYCKKIIVLMLLVKKQLLIVLYDNLIF